MQSALWYLAMPGTTVTGRVGSACLSPAGDPFAAGVAAGLASWPAVDPVLAAVSTGCGDPLVPSAGAPGAGGAAAGAAGPAGLASPGRTARGGAAGVAAFAAAGPAVADSRLRTTGSS
jgi:hypothetical protein